MSELIDLPVTQVVVLEDRATVRRSATVDLTPGPHRFRVESVSPIISDKTLFGKVGGGRGKVLDLRVRRRRRFEEEEPDAPDAEFSRELNELRLELEAENRELSRLAEALNRHGELAAQWADEIARDLSCRPAEPEQWRADWSALGERLEELTYRHEEVRSRRQEKLARLNTLEDEERARRTPSDDIDAELELTVVMEEAARVELMVEYCVPNACWRPCHVAEWIGEALRFESQACLWQNTGEDWNGVNLIFSTARPTLGTEPPEIAREGFSIVQKQKSLQVSTRETSVRSVERGHAEMPGIDSAGEILNFCSSEPADVPSDGRPYRVPLFEFQAGVSEERRLMGELAQSVFLETRLTNAGSAPILAGPVDLIKACGLAGRGYLDFVAVGESFRIGWGPHPELRCSRREEQLPVDSQLLGGWQSRCHQIEVHVSNLGASPQSLQVLERIPVSDLKGVKIEQDLEQTSGGKLQDKDGFLNFDITVPPFGRETVTVGYRISWKKHVSGL